jgi:hypothetical protein
MHGVCVLHAWKRREEGCFRCSPGSHTQNNTPRHNYPRRSVDTALANIGQPRLPLEHALFEFGSWMGGDRDGNPNVTAQTTRDVCILAR